jgi:dienelactone hydrolase
MKEITANMDAWRARAQAGLSVLAGHPMTDTTRMAAIGYCFGGATVQQLAYAGAALKGVVSFHGSPISPPEGLESSVKILICHGAADPFAKPEQVQAYLAAMGASNLDWQAIFYGGARHSFTNPDADAVGMEALKYDKSADMRSWAAMRVFFDEIFGT